MRNRQIEAPGSEPCAFGSDLLGTGDAFELSFDPAGGYELFCILHPEMAATVTGSS